MAGSIPVIKGHAHILRDKVDGTTKYRWSCSCLERGTFPPQTRRGQWHRQILTVLESFRQHWSDVHKEKESPTWDFVTNRVMVWAIQPPRDYEERWEDTRGTKILDMFAGRKATVQITNLNTGAVSTATGSYIATPTFEEEKKGMSRLNDIEARMRELEKEAAKYARFSKTDEWPPGTVITYTWTEAFATVTLEPRSYSYAVLKASNSKWYWTGEIVKGRLDGDYDTLVEHLADSNVSDIRVATPGKFDLLFPMPEVEDSSTAEGDLATGGVYVPVVKGKNG